mgnify:CR=1 FL=1
MASRRVRGAGGQSARRAARTNLVIDTAKYIERNIPNFEIMNLESLEIIEEKESAKIDKSPKREAQPKKKNNSSYQKQLEPNKQLIAQNETAPEREAIIEKPITEPLKGLEADIPQIKPLDLNATVAELQPTTEEAPAYKVTIVSNGIKEDKNLISGIGKKVDQVEGILGKVDEGFATLQDAKNSLFTSLTSKKEKVTEKP